MIFCLLRVNDAMMLRTEDRSHMIIKPIKFHGHVIRKLSDWCSVVPDISVDAELPSLEVQLCPGDYIAILSLMNSLSDGRSITPHSVKGTIDSEEGKDEETVIPTTFSGATSSDYVKLSIKFQMKEVLAHV